jgi:hypothetical protein
LERRTGIGIGEKEVKRDWKERQEKGVEIRKGKEIGEWDGIGIGNKGEVKRIEEKYWNRNRREEWGKRDWKKTGKGF